MGPESRRILIATVASVGILVVWQLLFPAPKQAPKPAAPAPVAATAPAPANAAPAAPLPGAPAQPAAVPEAPEELITLQGTEFIAVLSCHGGTLAHLELKDPKFQAEREGKVGAHRPRPHRQGPAAAARAVGLAGAGRRRPIRSAIPATRASMRVVSRDAGAWSSRGGSARATRAEDGAGSPASRTSSASTLEVTGAPAAGTLSLLYTGHMPPSTSSGGMFSGPPLDFLMPVCRGGEKTKRFKVDGDEVKEKVEGVAGLGRHRPALLHLGDLPGGPAGGRLRLHEGGREGERRRGAPDPGGGGRGAGQLHALRRPQAARAPQDATAAAFETAVDYGSFTNTFAFFAQILLQVMRWFHGFVGNWGVAIILLTLR